MPLPVSLATAILTVALAAGCPSKPSFDRPALLDPASCQQCHPNEFRQWSGSMHAYASDDPIFLALNAAGQQDTNGALGSLCVGCHAPMAVREGATTDGLNLAEVPRRLQGITCYFCHSVDGVEALHNNQLNLASDGVMRGAYSDPLETEAHKSSYSNLHDSRQLGSSELCGSCHDVLLPNGLLIEGTYTEWKASLFAKPGPAGLSCNRCHMPGSDGIAAEVADAPQRRVLDHGFPGIDMAVSPWPEGEAQRAGIDRDLQPSILAKLCVTPSSGGVDVEVWLDNLFAGHSWPSGVTHARRAWVELIAYRDGDIVYQSGTVGPGKALTNTDDPDRWVLRSQIFDDDGNEVEVAWKAATMTSNVLTAAVTNDPTDPGYFHARNHIYAVAGTPDRVIMVLHMRPVGLEIVDHVIEDAALNAQIRAAMPTYTLEPTRLEWSTADGFGCNQ